MKKTLVGGQAVIEGVLMRGPKYIATAVRKKDNSIVYKKTELSNTNTILFKTPFFRGIVALFDAMIMGTKELIFSANTSGSEEEKLTDEQVVFTVSMSLLISIAMFMLLPSLIGTFIFKNNVLGANFIEAIVRMVIFLGYIYIMTINKDMQRIFEYHGAEHKTIMNYEKNIELTPENAKECTRFHPRCGTSFLLIVMLISIFIFSIADAIFIVPTNIFLLIIYKILTRILLVPIIASFSYELQRWASSNIDKNICAIYISKPGLWLQKLTTCEPSLDQLEVAIVALKVALGEEVENATEVFE